MYKPGYRSLDKILISLGHQVKNELALPGNWSPSLFVSDLFDYPVESKDKLAKAFQKGMIEGWTYRKFYEETRGQPRNISNPEVWDVFDTGALMMIAEELFLILLQRECPPELLLYLKALSQSPTSEWNNIVSNCGACCWEFFLKDPFAYIQLLHRSNTWGVRTETDFEMIDVLGYTPNVNNRTELIQIFESRLTSSVQNNYGSTSLLE